MLFRKSLLLLVLASLFLGACSGAATQAAPTSVPTAAPLPTNTPIPTPAAPPTPTPLPPAVWIDPALPDSLRAAIELPAGMTSATNKDQASLFYELNGEKTVTTWVYALAAPFNTIRDDISTSDLKTLWTTGTLADGPKGGLIVNVSTHTIFTALWGPPANSIQIVTTDQLLSKAWEINAWSILPFELLEPKWKVLTVDGQSPVQKDFNPATSPLTVQFGLSGDTATADKLGAVLPMTNRDPQKMTTLVMTGVTAMVRGTAAFMERFGMDYPARDIAPILQQADLLHINNEVPFAEDCPFPYPWKYGLVFCSKPQYAELLDFIGTDIVELSGDHFHDWGIPAMQFTLSLYHERDWMLYGGGANVEEGRKPLLVENNGNRLAFLGCNAKPPGYATATATDPGSVPCDWDYLDTEIRQLKEQGYMVIVSFQHLEYYDYAIRPQLQKDFERVAQAGAIIVSGSQAHQPHGIEFTDGSFLHYGLGNLFFDQVYSDTDTDKAFIDRHVFYNNQYISTELISIQFVDYALSRLSTPAERQLLLQKLFGASIWE